VSRFSRIQRVAVTGSTNEDIAAVLGDEQARGLTLVADYQERGAGRKGRVWIAPPGTALLCTIALPDPVPSTDLWAVPFWTALIVQAAMHDMGAKAQLQWPNDLLLERRKVCGILCVSRVAGDYACDGRKTTRYWNRLRRRPHFSPMHSTAPIAKCCCKPCCGMPMLFTMNWRFPIALRARGKRQRDCPAYATACCWTARANRLKQQRSAFCRAERCWSIMTEHGAKFL
jgi:hypothetical protein